MQKPEIPNSFPEFWPFYILQHLHPTNRKLHAFGTGLSFVCLGFASITENPVFLILAVLVGYGFAWFGHFKIEKNKPATFRAPFFSLLGDWRMFYLMVNGKMNAEVERVLAESKNGKKHDKKS